MSLFTNTIPAYTYLSLTVLCSTYGLKICWFSLNKILPDSMVFRYFGYSPNIRKVWHKKTFFSLWIYPKGKIWASCRKMKINSSEWTELFWKAVKYCPLVLWTIQTNNNKNIRYNTRMWFNWCYFTFRTLNEMRVRICRVVLCVRVIVLHQQFKLTYKGEQYSTIKQYTQHFVRPFVQ